MCLGSKALVPDVLVFTELLRDVLTITVIKCNIHKKDLNAVLVLTIALEVHMHRKPTLSDSM